VTRFAKYAWGLLAYDVAVAAWGVYVRATGSGAGCGRHWPLCNGELVPRAPRVQTLIELSHRASSGVALLATAILFAWSPFAFPRGDIVRRGSLAALAFMGTEALLGAGLVLFQLVGVDQSVARGVSVSLHLVNTFFLLAATASTAWWASGGAAPRSRAETGPAWTAWVPLVAMLFVGASGAVTALGDTLFPPSSLAAGFTQDTATTAHLFVRLRVLHPLLAMMTAAVVIVAAGVARALHPSPAVRPLSIVTTVLVATQVGAGLLDVVLLAPTWLQLLHVSLAYGMWISLVLLATASLGSARQSAISSRKGAAPSSEVPPSTSNVAPVTYAAAGETRKSTASQTSSIVP
jgi:heme A synthase